MGTSGSAETSLRRRVARGGAWMLGLRAFEQTLRLARLVIVARLLAPEQLGVMGIALLTLATLQTFTDAGFHISLLRRRGSIDAHLDTAWSISLLRGIALFAVLAVAAPWIAAFFDTAEATGVIRVLGATFLIQGLTNPAITRFQRDLRFDRQFAMLFAGTLVDAGVAVGCVLWMHSVWALVLGFLAGDLVRLVASYMLEPWRPRFAIERDKAAELWGFGKWLLGSSVLVFVSTQGDDVVVGKLLGPAMLAFYQVAFRISNMPATELSRLVATVALPAFAKLQGEPERLRRGYLEALQLTATFAAPIAALVFVLAPRLTAVLLGETWLPAVPAMRVLAVCGLARGIAAPGPLFLALGRPELRTRLQLIGLLVLVVTLVPLTMRWGIVGAAAAATGRAVIMKILAVAWALRLTGLPRTAGVRTIAPPLASSTLAGLLLFAFESRVVPATSPGSLALAIAVGGAAWLVIGRLLDRTFDLGGERLIRDHLSALAGKS